MFCHIRTLGDAAIESSAGSSPFAIGKPFALLVYVALRRQRMTRDELAALFWPQVPREKALQSLRQALWLLRRSLGELFVPGEAVELLRDVVRVDVQDLRELLARNRVEEASALRRGPFLGTVVIPGLPDWERWVEETRSEVDRVLAQGLAGRAVEARAAGEISAAMALMERAVEIDPYEAAHPPVLIEMRLDAWQLESAAEALARARRDVPGPEFLTTLNRLESRLSAQRAELAARRSAIGAPEFVGRTAELALLLGQWRVVRGKRSLAALVRGPTGIGKTRLVEELAAVARTEGAATVIAKAAETDRSLDWALATTLIRKLLVTPGSAGITAASDAVLRSLVPSLSASQRSDPGPVAAAAIADALRDLVGAIAYEAPLLIALDDFHWADAASRAALVRVIRKTRDEPILFLITFRPEDTSVETSRAIDALCREDGASTVTLRPLSRPEVAELLGMLAEYSVPDMADQIAERFHRATGGNPLFLIELLRVLHEDGTIRSEDGRTVLEVERLPEGLVLPRSMHAVLHRRLDRLGDEAVAVITQLANRSIRLGATDVQMLARLSDSAFLRGVAELHERDIVEWKDDRLVFTHDQLREAAARRFRETYEHTRAQPRDRRILHAATAAAIVLSATALVLTAVRGDNPTPNAFPFGSGTFYFRDGDSILVARPPRSIGDPFTVSRPVEPTPRSATSVGPFVAPDGQRRWFEVVEDTTEAPYVAEILPDGSRFIIARSSGYDIGTPAVSPDGRRLAYNAENPATTTYDLDIVLAQSDGRDPRVLHRGAEKLGAPSWSPDGSRIAFAAHGRQDTLIVMAPPATKAASVVFDLVNGVAWCGTDLLAASVKRQNDSLLALIDVTNGQVQWVDPASLGTQARGLPSNLACSTDGVLVFNWLVHGRTETVAHNRTTGETATIDVPAGAKILGWIPERMSPVETEVVIGPAPATLKWAEIDTLEAVVMYSDGASRPVPAAWESTDPATISVSPSGQVTANGPGRATLIAHGRAWHTDSVEIEVRGQVEERVVFRDTFPTIDTTRWIVLGVPTPRLTRLNGERVLELTGDGQWADGLVLREPARMERGATFELEFRFALTRRDRQRLVMCFANWDRVPRHDESSQEGWDVKEDICAAYPSGELAKFDSAAVDLAATPLIDRVRPSDGLPTIEWVHMALQVRPDGQAALFVNRLHVADTPRPIPMPREGWRVVLLGAALETNVYVRNLALSHGSRFSITRGPAR
jgi:DNA-binding SARP family transcriptional activator